MNHAANTAFEAAKEAFASLAPQGLRHIHWEILPSWTICLVVLAVPATIAVPPLGALGFTSIGPAAGTVAAWFQAAFGHDRGVQHAA
ncbi:hypothetical protein KC345_g4978 [Hortaea werneckii]|nr:hypothetical protein KC345_g4978 [Hortaea werneckii]